MDAQSCHPRVQALYTKPSPAGPVFDSGYSSMASMLLKEPHSPGLIDAIRSWPSCVGPHDV
jgi:hypothetical protein